MLALGQGVGVKSGNTERERMAKILDREDLAELATLVPLIRELQQAHDSRWLQVPGDALVLLKQRVATLLGKLTK